MAAELKDQFDILGQVRHVIETTLKMRANLLDVDADIGDIGVDSIVAMGLITILTKQFDVSISPAQFSALKTVRELAAVIEQGVSSRQPALRNRDADRRAQMPRASAGDQVTAGGGRTDNAPAAPESSGASYRELLGYVYGKYSIDLRDLKFGSIDEIVERLVSGHARELQAHYRRSAGPESAAQAADVAIVGIGCRFPGAPSAPAFWDHLLSGKNAIREITNDRWNWHEHYSAAKVTGKTISRWGALLDDIDCFDAAFFGVSESDAKRLDPQERLLYQEVYHAFEDAGLGLKQAAGSRTGVFVGYEYAEYEHLLRKLARRSGAAQVYGSSSPAYYLANRLSYVFDLRGPSEAINVNCASSAISVNRACYSLLNREADLAVAAGVSLNLFADDYISETHYGLLSPDGTCAVFDDNANGFTRGEGVGAVVLKRLEDARRENNRIYAVIKGCHQNNRGRTNTLSDISHESITNVLRECHAKLSMSAQSLDYIEVDGYSTKWGDSFELEGIKNVFADIPAQGKFCALGSLKGNIGHLEPASGIASVIKVALSLHHKKFPATISKRNLSEFIDIDSDAHPLYIADKCVAFEAIRRGPRTPIRAGVNSFADSGSNVHIVMEEYLQNTAVPCSTQAGPQLFVLSARDRRRLDDYAGEFIDMLSSPEIEGGYDSMIHTLQVGRDAMHSRLAIVASSAGELREKIRLWRSLEPADRSRLEQNGVYHRDIEADGGNPLAKVISAEMIAAEMERSLAEGQWERVALLWINGVEIPWRRLWEGRAIGLATLPGYPFARDRYWADSVALDVKAVDEVPAIQTSNEEWRFPVGVNESAAGGGISGLEKMELFLKQEFALQLKQPIAEVAVDRNYLDLGLTSLGVVAISRRINRLLETKVSPTMFAKYPDIRRLAIYLHQGFPEKTAGLGVAARQLETVGDWQSMRPEWVSGARGEQLAAEVSWEASVDDGSYERIDF
jgi:3-oxoacyl-(acyl-carrier-protein) synthase/acyl carrier protein